MIGCAVFQQIINSGTFIEFLRVVPGQLATNLPCQIIPNTLLVIIVRIFNTRTWLSVQIFTLSDRKVKRRLSFTFFETKPWKIVWDLAVKKECWIMEIYSVVHWMKSNNHTIITNNKAFLEGVAFPLKTYFKLIYLLQKKSMQLPITIKHENVNPKDKSYKIFLWILF